MTEMTENEDKIRLSMDANILQKISDSFIDNYGIIPLRIENDSLIAALLNVEDTDAIKFVSQLFDCAVIPIQVSVEEWEQLRIGKNESESIDTDNDILSSDENLEELTIGPVIMSVNSIIKNLINSNCTHAIITTKKNISTISYYAEDSITGRQKIDCRHYDAILNRLKIMSDINVSNKAIPQTGNINVKHDGRMINLQIKTMPAQPYEICRLELFEIRKYQLSKLGWDENLATEFSDIIVNSNNGVIVISTTKNYLLKNFLYTIFDLDVFDDKTVISIDNNNLIIKYTHGEQTVINAKNGYTAETALDAAIDMDYQVVIINKITASLAGKIYLQTGRLFFINVIADSIASVEKQIMHIFGVSPENFSMQTLAILHSDGKETSLQKFSM